jgi:hypothetical protein
MSEFKPKTFLFTLRIWGVPADGNHVGWRGKLQTLPNGETYYFHGWEALVGHLETIVRSAGASTDHSKLDDFRGG